MGQYYTGLLICPDQSMISLNTHDFDNGAKLMEHSWIGNDFVNAAYMLLQGKRRRIAWIGDYANDPYDPEQDAYARAMDEKAFQRYYNAAWNDEVISMRPSRLDSDALERILTLDTTGTYLINHDKRQYLPLGEYIAQNRYKEPDDKYFWCVNPLPLLTACGNGRGGGDYRTDGVGAADVGTWAFDLLEYTEKPPASFERVMFHFKDQ